MEWLEMCLCPMISPVDRDHRSLDMGWRVSGDFPQSPGPLLLLLRRPSRPVLLIVQLPAAEQITLVATLGNVAQFTGLPAGLARAARDPPEPRWVVGGGGGKWVVPRSAGAGVRCAWPARHVVRPALCLRHFPLLLHHFTHSSQLVLWAG